MMIRTRLFIGFAVLVMAFGILSAFIGVSLIRDRVVKEAQTRVRSDLNSAWSVVNAELHRIEIILKLATGIQRVLEACAAENWPNQEVQNRLEVLRMDFGLDFFGIVSPRGQVAVRSTPPYNTGDFRLSNPVILRALRGETLTAIELLSGEDLEREQAGLAEKAFLVLEETPRAKPTPKTEETRGMVLMGATPIKRGSEIIGTIYGGILLNRNYATVDRITEIVFQHGKTQSMTTGTVTIFLGDTRVATTVRKANGNRAIGTRVSEEVADRVLENGQRWEGRAFVVNDWYLTAYDPIRDCQGQVIGMLYVGILERPFTELVQETIVKYALLSLVGLTLALILAFFLAGRLAEPLQRLSEAARKMYMGERPAPVTFEHASDEIKTLMQTFNKMAETITERETKLKEANEKLEEANISLKNLNRNYMETVGFITHELKSPLAAIMNYVFLVRKKLGALNEKQERALKNIDSNVRRTVEMVRHYLNLSRIENDEFEPIMSRVELLDEVLTPLLESLEATAADRNLTFLNMVNQDVVLQADLNMMREAFENLINNAIKYSQEGGMIKISAQTKGDFIQFSVFNEGEGIAPEKAKAIFQKFSRLEDNQTTRRQKGTGLGLFITQHIIHAHGGEIHVESKQREGVEFIFTLPRYDIEH